MTREAFHIRYKLGFATCCCDAADSTAEGYRLARHLAMERPQDQLVGYCPVEDVEASPIDKVAGARQGVKNVPEERGSVRRVAGIRGVSASSSYFHRCRSDAPDPVTLAVEQRRSLLDYLSVGLCLADVGSEGGGICVDLPLLSRLLQAALCALSYTPRTILLRQQRLCAMNSTSGCLKENPRSHSASNLARPCGKAEAVSAVSRWQRRTSHHQ